MSHGSNSSGSAVRRLMRVACLGLCLGAAVLAAGGCNIVGAAIVIAEGPPKIDAKYRLPKESRVVVFVDDRNNRLPRSDLKVALAEAAEAEILRNKLVESVVSGRTAIAVARNERYGETLSISEIGEQVTADVVVWVGVENFTLSPDGATFTPSADLLVKVIDVDDRVRMWPSTEEAPRGQKFTIRMRQQQGTIPADRADMLRSQQQLATFLGVGIAQLFYTHERSFSNLRDTSSEGV